MESLLGFTEPPPASEVVLGQSLSFKLVPWISWDEWDCVRSSLFSSSPQSTGSALHRIAAWRSRGCLPVVVEVTASIIEVQQKDPFFRGDLHGRTVDSDEMLSMLYCMAIMRLVNCVIERTRKKTETSIAEAAEAIGIPRMLIDIRHEGSHRDLPSLQLLRVASKKALDWLKSYYWGPQKHALPNQGDINANLRKEIKSKIEDLFFSLRAKKTSRLASSTIKGKRAKRLESLRGPNKFLPFMSVKNVHTKTLGLKKQVTKSLKNVLRLYSSNSAEVVDVLLEFLLKSSESLGLTELVCRQNGGDESMPCVLDEWRHVIIKLSNKRPELLWSLVKAILEKIETQEDCNTAIGERITAEITSEIMAKFPKIKLLSFMFEWLVRILGSRKPSELKDSAAEAKDSCEEEILPKGIILELLRRCLLACSNGNNHLMTSGLLLAHMLENKSLNYKLEKLLSQTKLDHDFSEAWPFANRSENLLSLEKELIDQAAKSEDLMKLFQSKGKHLESIDNHVETKNRWVVSRSWNPCPIGMLPHTLGSSGQLPILDCKTVVPQLSILINSKNDWELGQYSGEGDVPCAVEPVDELDIEKAEEIEVSQLQYAEQSVTSDEDIKGRLMIDGVLKKVTEEELLAIASDIRILV